MSGRGSLNRLHNIRVFQICGAAGVGDAGRYLADNMVLLT
jgi:hypothetical protein